MLCRWRSVEPQPGGFYGGWVTPGLVVYTIYNGYWFWGRPSAVDLWHDLRAVSSEIRPDWDLSTRGLREAWNAGDSLASTDGVNSQCG